MRAPISFWTSRNLPSESPFNIWKDFDQFFDDVSAKSSFYPLVRIPTKLKRTTESRDFCSEAL